VLYAESLKSLPVATAEQTARFADHVADNHSWHKHLPLFPPGASFVLFPNAQAGRGVRMEGDRFVVYDIQRGDYFAHHSRLATADYLRQFGHWDYSVYDNPLTSHASPQPWLFSADGGDRELLADDLKRQWTCRLTAFLKPQPLMFEMRGSSVGREAEMFLASARRTPWRALFAVFGRRGRVPTEDSVAGRYRSLAKQVLEGAGSWGSPAVLQFMESEAKAQRQAVLGTLHRVRTAWSKSRGGTPGLGL